ncbi:hypothetical protein [Streptomyces poriticola]|uniref:hypothetical protein n=1 Tax=Streptomyces poriticola TaxID=3120506 RepID=UPI0038CD52EE
MVPALRRQTIAGEARVLRLAAGVLVVLLAVAAVSLARAKATFHRVEGRRVTALAEQPAVTPLMRSRLQRRVPGPALAALVSAAGTQSGATVVMVAGRRGPDGHGRRGRPGTETAPGGLGARYRSGADPAGLRVSRP